MALNSSACACSERGQDDFVAQTERARGDGLAQACQVVLVGAADLLDQAVQPQALEDARDLSAGLAEALLQIAVAQAADGEFAFDDGLEQGQVVVAKEVEVPARRDWPSAFVRLRRTS